LKHKRSFSAPSLGSWVLILLEACMCVVVFSVLCCPVQEKALHWVDPPVQRILPKCPNGFIVSEVTSQSEWAWRPKPWDEQCKRIWTDSERKWNLQAEMCAVHLLVNTKRKKKN